MTTKSSYTADDSKAKLKEEYIKNAQHNLDSCVASRVRKASELESLDSAINKLEEHLKHIQDMGYEDIKKLNFRGVDSY